MRENDWYAFTASGRSRQRRLAIRPHSCVGAALPVLEYLCTLRAGSHPSLL
jgi:hypothetical protein